MDSSATMQELRETTNQLLDGKRYDEIISKLSKMYWDIIKTTSGNSELRASKSSDLGWLEEQLVASYYLSNDYTYAYSYGKALLKRCRDRETVPLDWVKFTYVVEAANKLGNTHEVRDLCNEFANSWESAGWKLFLEKMTTSSKEELSLTERPKPLKKPRGNEVEQTRLRILEEYKRKLKEKEALLGLLEESKKAKETQTSEETELLMKSKEKEEDKQSTLRPVEEPKQAKGKQTKLGLAETELLTKSKKKKKEARELISERALTKLAEREGKEDNKNIEEEGDEGRGKTIEKPVGTPNLPPHVHEATIMPALETELIGNKQGEGKENTEVEGDENRGKTHQKTVVVSSLLPYAHKPDIVYNLVEGAGDDHYWGWAIIEGRPLVASFIRAYHDKQITDVLSLKALCSSHESLLEVDSFTTISKEDFLVTEHVNTVGAFFNLRLEEFLSNNTLSAPGWWQHIQDVFKVIFRDVTTALLHLFHRNFRCGHLSFGVFVTESGRGRLLPSYDPDCKEVDDVKELIQVMKTVLGYPFVGDGTKWDSSKSGLPAELLHMLETTVNRTSFVPAAFLIDHPCLWSPKERTEYVDKLKTLMTETEGFMSKMNDTMYAYGDFKNWEASIQDEICKNIYSKGVASKANTSKVKPYKDPVDIVRFFRAVYWHVNDDAYKARRGCRDIVISKYEMADCLHEYYPMFYVIMYEAICEILETSSGADVMLNADSLKVIASRYSRDKDHRDNGPCLDWDISKYDWNHPGLDKNLIRSNLDSAASTSGL